MWHGAVAAPTVIALDQAELLISDTLRPPVDVAPGWQTVDLPDPWPAQRYRQGDNGWYRFQLTTTPRPDSLWGIYLPRLNMNAAVYFNGVLLGNGGSFEEPLGRNWSRPLYFTIPPSLWRADTNVIHIRLKSYYGYGMLGRPVIGPETVVAPLFNTQQFWQVSLAKALFLMLIAISLFMFSIWRQRRHDRDYFWFALTTLSWALLALNIFIHEIPLSATWWDRLMYSNIAWWTVFVALFSHRFARIHAPRLEIGYVLWAVVSTVAYLSSDLQDFPAVTALWQIGSPVIGFILIACLLKRWRQQRQPAVAGLALGIVLVQLAGIYTYLSQSLILPPEVQIFGHALELASPILLVLIAWHLTGRFVHALNEAEALTTELEARVATKGRKLEATYQRLAELEKERAITAERERIHRDLHDDVGAKLLSLTYRAGDDANAELARSALQDLRDVVSRPACKNLTLTEALADWRSECNDRLDGLAIELQWRQPPDLPAVTLAGTQIMNTGRILREAVSNAIRHAAPSRVSVNIAVDDGNVCIDIENDGAACTPPLHGRGTQNMAKRAAQLGGGITWQPGPAGGCCIHWWLPLTRPAT